MSNPLHVFTLQDVFVNKFSEKSMKKLLELADGISMPLRKHVTLGDIALQNGSTEAWWCTRILSDFVRRDVLKAVLPSIKRVLKKHPKHDGVFEAIALMERYIESYPVTILDVRSCSVLLQPAPRQSFNEAIILIMDVMCEIKYTDNLVRGMSIIDGLLDPVDRNKQIDDICKIFQPICKVESKLH